MTILDWRGVRCRGMLKPKLDTLPIVGPDLVESNGLAVASALDLFGTKCVTIAQRNERKDYQYDPLMTLQALSYFADLAEPLDERTKKDLLAAVAEVSLESLPAIGASGEIGAASPGP